MNVGNGKRKPPTDSPDFLLPPYGPRVEVPLWDPGPRLRRPWEALGGLLSRRGSPGELEAGVRSLTGAGRVASYSSGGAALTAGLMASRLPRRGEVIIPSYICGRVADAVISAGLRLCLVDVGEDGLISTGAVEEAVGDSSCAIIAPHLYGKLCDMPALSEIATDNGLILVDDSAQAIGASSGSRMAGSMGDFGIISFGPGKVSSGIGGGCLLTDSEEIFRALPEPLPPPGILGEMRQINGLLVERRLRKAAAPYRHLKKPSPRNLLPPDRPPRRVAVEGMGLIQSRACLASLNDIGDDLGARRLMAAWLREELHGIDATLPGEIEGRAWRGYPVLLSGKHRYEVAVELAGSRVETIPPYVPIHMQGRYREYYRISGNLQVSEDSFRRLVILPLHRGMGQAELELVAGSLRRAVGPGI